MSLLVLPTTTSQIRMALAAAGTAVRAVTAWADSNLTAETFGESGTFAVSAGTTPVSIVPAPSGTDKRVVRGITIYNGDSVSHTVTVDAYDGTTSFPFFKAPLGPGEIAQFAGGGWVVLSATGAVKAAEGGTLAPVSSGWSMNVLAADVTNNNATANTIADVTGLGFATGGTGLCAFRFFINYTAAATTTGSRWSISSTAGITALSYSSRYAATSTTETVNHGLTAFDLPAASNAGSAATGGNLAVVEGFVRLNAAGTVRARFASEVSGSAIVAKAGSYVQFLQVAA